MTDEAFPARLARIGQAFQESKIVLLGVDLGLFERLATGPATATELARDLSTTERGMEILTDALAATGYLVKRDDRLANTDDVDRYLVPGRPERLAHIMGHRNEMFGSCRHSLKDTSSLPPAKANGRSTSKRKYRNPAVHPSSKSRSNS